MLAPRVNWVEFWVCAFWALWQGKFISLGAAVLNHVKGHLDLGCRSWKARGRDSRDRGILWCCEMWSFNHSPQTQDLRFFFEGQMIKLSCLNKMWECWFSPVSNPNRPFSSSLPLKPGILQCFELTVRWHLRALDLPTWMINQHQSVCNLIW